MISEKMAAAINQQVNREYFAAYLYQSMAHDATDKGFKGAATWMKAQFVEEQEHAHKLADYLEERGSKVVLQALDKPKSEWKDLLEMFRDALEHERLVTAWINELYELAVAEKDFATQNMLTWFVDEQVEEEGSVQDVIWMLEMACENKGALFMVDRSLGERKED